MRSEQVKHQQLMHSKRFCQISQCLFWSTLWLFQLYFLNLSSNKAVKTMQMMCRHQWLKKLLCLCGGQSVNIWCGLVFWLLASWPWSILGRSQCSLCLHNHTRQWSRIHHSTGIPLCETLTTKSWALRLRMGSSCRAGWWLWASILIKTRSFSCMRTREILACGLTISSTCATTWAST